MLLIKYFRNTKAICLETQESFAEGPSSQETPIAGNGRQTERPAGGSRSTGVCARSQPGYLYKLMVGLWYMHMYASQRSLRAQP